MPRKVQSSPGFLLHTLRIDGQTIITDALIRSMTLSYHDAEQKAQALLDHITLAITQIRCMCKDTPAKRSPWTSL